MRRRKINPARGWRYRLGLMVLVASSLLAVGVRATEMETLASRLPRAYVGEFTWDDQKVAQSVTFTFESARALGDRDGEAVGCGAYENHRNVTTVKIRMFMRLSDLQVEIWEQSPEGATPFETDGSHRGNLSEDLRRIDAQWTTRLTGRHGQLHLHAISTAVCAPMIPM
jgi:hypothetical protein